jgi:hypothetical protein
MARVHHVHGAAQIVKGMGRMRLAEMCIADLGDGDLRMAPWRECPGQEAHNQDKKQSLEERSLGARQWLSYIFSSHGYSIKSPSDGVELSGGGFVVNLYTLEMELSERKGIQSLWKIYKLSF